MSREPTTRDSLRDKQARVTRYLSDPRNHDRSNREIAAFLQVDEKMVRQYKAALGIVPNPVGTHGPKAEAMKQKMRRKR